VAPDERVFQEEVAMGSVRVFGSDPYPWYRSHTRAALLTACVLFAAVTAFHVLVSGTGQAVDILYTLPIALVAMSFGLRGGLIGAGIAFALFAVVELYDGVGDIDATGWLTRLAVLFLLGALLGHATDQIDAGQRRTLADHEERRILAERTRRQAEALEISDSILQHLAVAKWMIEAGNDDRAITILASTMATGEQMVADLLPIRCGDIGGRPTVERGSGPAPADSPGSATVTRGTRGTDSTVPGSTVPGSTNQAWSPAG
jgi:hypothetical protein